MSWNACEPFDRRVAGLPWLGLGISTEFGAGRSGLDVNAFRRSRPELCGVLEIGADLERGVDEDARAWVADGAPTTYHFLDVNLEERESLDAEWMSETAELARGLGAAWLCGDAGLWHLGPRDRGHGTLMPPVLDERSAAELADNVALLREATSFEVLPENPPAHVYLGALHLLDYFGRVAELGDCGLLLDVAHVAAFQRVRGHEPLDGFEGFPFERVVEIHVAGGRLFEHAGRLFVEDDHGAEPLPETWSILDHVLPRVRNLRALIVEAERNPLERALPLFEAVERRLDAAGLEGSAG